MCSSPLSEPFVRFAPQTPETGLVAAESDAPVLQHGWARQAQQIGHLHQQTEGVRHPIGLTQRQLVRRPTTLGQQRLDQPAQLQARFVSVVACGASIDRVHLSEH